MNPFHISTGSDLLRNPIVIGIVFISTILLGYALAIGGYITFGVVIAMPILFYAFYRLILKPELGVTFALILNFFVIGISRYIPIKLGYLMDITLIGIYIAMFFHYYDKKIDLRPANTDLTYLAIVWFSYIFLELFNPEALNKTAWFASMRGIGFYFVLMIPLIQLLYNQPKFLDRFLKIWGVISVFASLKAWGQLNIGTDRWEQKWLDEVGGTTHVLWGNLRAFSFFSDAGQFGTAQGQMMIVAFILLMNTKKLKTRLFWFVVMIASYYGMSSSGTRGAVFVPLAGGALYMIIKKNVKVLLIGGIALVMIFSFFRYTTIGNSNYQIYRMRTAFTPEDDASFQVRIKNQAIFEDYLRSRPFGGGIGHAGERAKTYTGETFLSNVATDSWYVLIWAESGIVGLFLYMFIIGWIIGKGTYICMFQLKDHDLWVKSTALLCGFFGIVFASYGNTILGQFPTGLIVYSSMAYIFMAPSWEAKYAVK